VVLAILGVIAALAVPQYRSALETSRYAKAKQELKLISIAIEAFRVSHGRLPLTLYEIGYGGRRDPWGTPYCYINYAAGTGDGLAWAVDSGLVDPAALPNSYSDSTWDAAAPGGETSAGGAGSDPGTLLAGGSGGTSGTGSSGGMTSGSSGSGSSGSGSSGSGSSGSGSSGSGSSGSGSSGSNSGPGSGSSGSGSSGSNSGPGSGSSGSGSHSGHGHGGLLGGLTSTATNLIDNTVNTVLRTTGSTSAAIDGLAAIDSSLDPVYAFGHITDAATAVTSTVVAGADDIVGVTLSDVEATTLIDKLGGNSMYVDVDVPTVRRRNQYMFPLNTDYDLFSLGPNALTAAALNSPMALDDVIRANNGGFFGKASDY